MYYYNPLVPVKNEDGTWYRNLNISQNYNPLSMINEDRYDTKEKLLQGTAQATLQLILKVKYWMYQEQANGNPTLQLILQIYDLITYSL